MIGDDCYDDLLGGNKESRLSDYFEDILIWDNSFGSKQAEPECQKAKEKTESKTPESLLKPTSVVKESEGDDGYYDEFIADVPSASASSRSKKCHSKTFWKKDPLSHPASQENIKDRPLHEVHNGQNRCAKGRNIKNQEDENIPTGDPKVNHQRRLTNQMQSKLKKQLGTIQEENLNFKKSNNNASKQEQGQRRKTIFNHVWYNRLPAAEPVDPISNAKATPPTKTDIDKKYDALKQCGEKVEAECTKQNKPLTKLETSGRVLRDPGPSAQRMTERDVYIKEDKPFEPKIERGSDKKGLSIKSNDEQGQRLKTSFNQRMTKNSPATFVDSNTLRPQPVDSISNVKATPPAETGIDEKHNATQQETEYTKQDKPLPKLGTSILRDPGPSDLRVAMKNVHIKEDKPFEPSREKGNDKKDLSTANEQNKPLPKLETSTKLLRDPGPSNKRLTNSDDHKKEDKSFEQSEGEEKDTKDPSTVSKSKNEQGRRQKTVLNQSMSKNIPTTVVDSNTLRYSKLQVAQSNIHQPPLTAFHHPILPVFAQSNIHQPPLTAFHHPILSVVAQSNIQQPPITAFNCPMLPVAPCAFCDCPYPLMNQLINPNIYIPLMNNAHNAPKPPDVKLNSNYTQKSPPDVKLNSNYTQKSAPDVKLNSNYTQKSPPDVKLNSKYTQKSPPDVKLNSKYTQKSPLDVKLNSKYTQKSPPDVKLNSNYTQKSSPDVKPNSNYTQKSPSSRKYEAPVKILRNPRPYFQPEKNTYE